MSTMINRPTLREVVLRSVPKALDTANESVLRIRMRILTAHTIALSAAFLLALLSIPAHAQSSPPDPKAISVIDAEIGPCSAEFTVTDNAGAPIYAATIKVHIAWGFMSARKLDLEVGTNASGKARFIGLPAKPKQGLFFRASDGSREGSAFDDPVKTCTAQFTIVLEKKNSATAQLRTSLLKGMSPFQLSPLPSL